MCRGKALPRDDWIIAIIAEGRGLLCSWVLPVLLAQRGNSRGQNLPWNQHTKRGHESNTTRAGSNCSFLLKCFVRFKRSSARGVRLSVWQRWRGHACLTRLTRKVFLPSRDESVGQLQASAWKTHVRHRGCSIVQGWVEKVNSQITEVAGDSASTPRCPQQHSSSLFTTNSHPSPSLSPRPQCADGTLCSQFANAALVSAVIKAHQYSAWPTNTLIREN